MLSAPVLAAVAALAALSVCEAFAPSPAARSRALRRAAPLRALPLTLVAEMEGVTEGAYLDAGVESALRAAGESGIVGPILVGIPIVAAASVAGLLFWLLFAYAKPTEDE